MDDLDALARLTARLENLEHRVCVLEHPPEKAVPVLPSPVVPATLQPTADAFSFAQAGGLFPVLGKAMLGIAGAYLLRAVAESGSFPKSTVVALALVYAVMWLVWAARVPSEARLARAVYSTTAALIIVPMLWELTLRFEVLPNAATAGVLVGFVVTAYALAWKRSLVSLVWVTNGAAVLAALALLVVTRDLMPFIVALLFMALVSEWAAFQNRWLNLRPLIAIAADLSIWILLWIYSRPEGIPAEYKAIAIPVLLAPGCMLFLIYGTSTVFRNTQMRQQIRPFEIGQTVVAFLLAAFSILRFGGGAGSTVTGIFSLLFSLGCYAVTYASFDRLPEQRNYHTYSAWSAFLFLAGCSLCLTPTLLPLCLSLAAIVATLLGVLASRLALECHGLLYLAAAAYTSGLLNYAGRALVGTFPSAPGWIVWIVAASAVACYAIGGRFRTEQWNQRFLQVLSAILAVAAVITFLVSLLVWMATLGVATSPSEVAVIRTLITCVVALALAFSGSRWKRNELLWIAYGTMVLVTAKLLFEDLQHGQPGSTAVSIFLYALTLILVPRMARVARRAS